MTAPAAGGRLGTISVLRRGWRASPELRAGATGTVVLALAGGAGRVAVPVLVQQVLDRGIRPAGVRLGTVAVLSAVALAVVVASSLAVRAARRRLAVASQNALAGLRTRTFDHVHRLSLAAHTEETRGALVSRVTSDVEQLSQFFAWGGVAWLVSGTTMLAVLVTMAAYDWRLTLVSVAAIAPMALVLRALQRRLAVAYDAVRTRMGTLLATLAESVTGAAVIRAFGAQERADRRALAAIDAQRDAEIRAGKISAFLFPSSEVFAVVTVAAVVAAGVALGPGQLSKGTLVAFVFLVTLFLEPVSEFTEIVDQTQTAVAGWRKVLDVLDTPIEVAELEAGVTLPPGAPELVVENVWFAYHRGPTVLHDVSATIPAGTRAALVGATGSGKTTLAKLLTRLADPTQGRILVHGIDLRDVAFRSLRSSLVMVPQDGFLFDTTIGENVRFGRRGATDEDIRLAFVELGLEPWLDGLPDGLDTRVGERGDRLSVGERQLVALARAYVANPTCLILDEATSAVDPATEVRLTRALESLARGRTSVTIAHRLSTAERADLVLVLEHGRLVESGTHAALVAAGGPYARLHASWIEGTAAAP